MLYHSTAESVDKGEISLLAIVETILATAIAIYLSVKFDSFKWIAWSACIAPFLLLRTEQSTTLGIKKFDDYSDAVGRMLNRMADKNYLLLLFAIFLYFCKLCFLPVLIRFAATLITLWTHPFVTFASIPTNWARLTLSLDACCPPEIVPGYNFGGRDESIRASVWLKETWDDLRQTFFLFSLILAPPLILATLILYVPSLLYRWSMKATSIVYLPFLWIAWATFRKMPEIAAALKRIRQSDLTKIVVIYSILVITGFAIKFILMAKWSNFAAWWNTTPLTEFLSIYVVPAEIPIWQFAAFINAFWAIGIFVFVKEAFLRIETGEPWSAKGVESVLRVSSFGRCVLSLYTIMCTGYLTVQAATNWNLPKLGTKLFPWMN